MKYNYLYSGLGETDSHGDLLAHENVRIVGLAEAPLQLVELRRREPGPMSLLLVRFSGVVAVEPGAATTGGSHSGSSGQPVTGRGRQVETAARQSERSAAASTSGAGGQLMRR